MFIFSAFVASSQGKLRSSEVFYWEWSRTGPPWTAKISHQAGRVDILGANRPGRVFHIEF